jgi:hypothetical protein
MLQPCREPLVRSWADRPPLAGPSGVAPGSPGRRRFNGSPPPRAVPPIHQYNHNDGRCAVVGGHVYRGTQIRGLQGAYLYSDVCDGRIRALARARGHDLRHRDLRLRLPGLVSFAEDRAGELYALSLAGGVYRLAAAR